ncbi:MAG: GGDEF domain-containing protein [Clostridia bacterium]|nr:GGDEF domain-containing protein [Clostridia bacterium]
MFYIADIAWGFLYDLKIVPLTYADTVIFFLTMGLSVFLWTRYVIAYINKKTVFSMVLNIAGWMILVFQAAALIVNFFTPIVFRFDAESGEYFPGNARYFMLGLQIMLYFVTAAYSLVTAVRAKGIGKRPFLTVGFSGLVMTVFIILQMYDPLLPYYTVGCLIASCLIHSFVTWYEKVDSSVELGSAIQKAYIDSMTGVRNYHAYSDEMKRIDDEIANDTLKDFGIVVLDLNGLKQINDTRGHDIGDESIKKACRIICELFAHSSVFRIGGDEFVILLGGADYENREELLGKLDAISRENVKTDDVVIASGIAEYSAGKDENLSAVFRRADQHMYEKKRELKRLKRDLNQ